MAGRPRAVVVKKLNNSKVTRNEIAVHSPLLGGVRRGIAASLRQKRSIGLDTLLDQYPEIVGPVVLAAIDDLAREGVVTIDASYCGSVSVTWHGDAGQAA